MRFRSAGLIFTVGFAAACGSSPNGTGPRDAGGDDAGPPATDAPADGGGGDAPADVGGGDVSADVGGGDAPADAPPDVPAPVVSFVFTNATTRSLYIQLFGFSGQAYSTSSSAPPSSPRQRSPTRPAHPSRSPRRNSPESQLRRAHFAPETPSRRDQAVAEPGRFSQVRPCQHVSPSTGVMYSVSQSTRPTRSSNAAR